MYIFNWVIMHMKVICIIPARYGSTRFEGKPLVDICGKTMIQRTYEQVKKSKLISEIYIATDDERIKNNAESFGANVVMTSKGHVCGTDRIAEALQNIAGEDDDVIVNVQGDEPLIEPESIDSAVKPFLKDHKLNMATLIKEIKDNAEYEDPSVVKVVKDQNNFALYCSRSRIPYSTENNPVGIYKQLGLYVFRRHFLIRFSKMEPSIYEKIEKLEQLRALENGFKMKVIETEYDSPSINVRSDLEKVIKIIKKQCHQKEQRSEVQG